MVPRFCYNTPTSLLRQYTIPNFPNDMLFSIHKKSPAFTYILLDLLCIMRLGQPVDAMLFHRRSIIGL